MIRRARAIAVVGYLLAGALGIISSTQTWITVRRADAGTALVVSGADALPLLAPLSLAVLALGAALSIAGTALRYVFAVLGVGGALVLALQTVPVLLDPPLGTVAKTVSEATGLGGDNALRDVVADLVPSVWPAVALVGWALLALASVLVLLTAHSWRRGGRRYEGAAHPPHRQTGTLDAVDSWDELSQGTDPTGTDR